MAIISSSFGLLKATPQVGTSSPTPGPLDRISLGSPSTGDGLYRFQPATLTPAEQAAMAKLPHPEKPLHVILADTDPGFDVDDESALVVAAALAKKGIITLDCAVATTDPSEKRAQLAKGALTELGLAAAEVAVGDSTLPHGFPHEEQRLQAPFLAAPEELKSDASAMVRQALEKAEDHSVAMVVIAKMTDANNFLKNNQALVQQKVKEYVLMGGVEQKSEQKDTTAADLVLRDGMLSANTVATNNRHDQEAANQLYRSLQELGVKTKVVTRTAATNTPISPDIFKEMAETGHSVAGHIRNIEGDFLNKFFQSAVHGQMGKDRDEKWFIETFCKAGTPTDLNANLEDIRPYLKSRVVYDALAVLASVDEISQQVFQPTKVRVNQVDHEVIGLSKAATGLLDPNALGALTTGLLKEGLRPAP